MTDSFPTGSVTGRREWEWNKWQRKQETQGDPADTADRRQPSRPAPGNSRPRRHPPDHPRHREGSSAEFEDRERRLRHIIDDLEAELEEKERRIQHIIRRYERLLSEKNRQLAAQNSSGGHDDSQLSVLWKIRQYLCDR